MTRSSTKELFTPFENPEREFRSSRKIFKTPSLDESSSPEFDLFSDLEEHSEEEVTGTMTETMEEYMCKTRAWERFKELLMKCPQHYLTDMQEVILFYNGLEVPTRQILNSKGVIPTKTASDVKIAIQEMAEYSQKWHNGTSRTRSTKTSDGLAAIQAQLNNLGREIKKVNEKVYAAQVGCELCKGPHYTKDCPLKEEGKTLEEAYYTQFGVPFPPRGPYTVAAPGFYQINNATLHAATRNQGASIKALEIQIGQMSKVLQERESGRSTRYAVSAQQNSDLIFEPKQATITFPSRLYNDCYDEEKGSYGLKYLDAYLIRTTLGNDALPQKEKDPGSFTLPCYINNVCFEKTLADLGASISVMPLLTYLNLGLGKLAHTKLTAELADMTVKHPKGIAKNVLVGIGKFVFPVDFIILDMPEDINVPLILGRPFLSNAQLRLMCLKERLL
ncbi:hypothetical protein Tco_0494079 [Tanacetum coccineum]